MQMIIHDIYIYIILEHLQLSFCTKVKEVGVQESKHDHELRE